MPFAVSTPVFEGPFDLLLHLITAEQVDLWEVSLSAIVDAYVATLEELRPGLDLETATEFLLIAAVLLELKARRLLPGSDDVETEEELALWEERDQLLARLLEAKTFKDAAGAMTRAMDAAALSHPRVAGADERFAGLVPDLLEGVTPQRLHDAYVRAVTPAPTPTVSLDHVTPVRTSVAEAVEELAAVLPGRGKVAFAALTGGLVERLEVIVRFLAVLELVKQGRLDVAQSSSFAEIHVEWRSAVVSADGVATVDEYAG